MFHIKSMVIIVPLASVVMGHICGLMEERRNSIANALELRLFH